MKAYDRTVLISVLTVAGSLASLISILVLVNDKVDFSIMQIVIVIVFSSIAGGSGWILGKYWKGRSIVCRIINNKKGEDSIELIKRTESLICVSHFQDDIPVDGYINAMIKKLKQESAHIYRVLPTRVLSDMKNKDSPYHWLMKFEPYRQDKTSFYHVIEVSTSLPFDIMILDDNVVAVTMPRNASVPVFSQDLLFESEKVVRVFRTCLDWFVGRYKVEK